MSVGIISMYGMSPRQTVDLPNFKGELSTYNINWVRPIIDNYYEIGATETKGLGGNLWLVKVVDGAIIPLSCTSYLSESEHKKFILAERLHLSTQDLMEQLLLQRIDNDRQQRQD